MGCIKSVDDLAYPVAEHTNFLVYLIGFIEL